MTGLILLRFLCSTWCQLGSHIQINSSISWLRLEYPRWLHSRVQRWLHSTWVARTTGDWLDLSLSVSSRQSYLHGSCNVKMPKGWKRKLSEFLSHRLLIPHLQFVKAHHKAMPDSTGGDIESVCDERSDNHIQSIVCGLICRRLPYYLPFIFKFFLLNSRTLIFLGVYPFPCVQWFQVRHPLSLTLGRWTLIVLSNIKWSHFSFKFRHRQTIKFWPVKFERKHANKFLGKVL